MPLIHKWISSSYFRPVQQKQQLRTFLSSLAFCFKNHFAFIVLLRCCPPQLVVFAWMYFVCIFYLLLISSVFSDYVFVFYVPLQNCNIMSLM